MLNSTYRVEPVEYLFNGANSDQVHSWIFNVPNANANEKYPVALVIHGGPQSSWSDSWSYRWNPQIFASQGYVSVLINFHGSQGIFFRFLFIYFSISNSCAMVSL